MSNEQTAEYIAKVFRLVSNQPTAGHLDELLEAHARIGYLAADAEGLAEDAENIRKYQEASAYLEAKRSGDKVTERQAEAMASVAVRDYRDQEAESSTKARKLRNLWESVEQVINGIKFLQRGAG